MKRTIYAAVAALLFVLVPAQSYADETGPHWNIVDVQYLKADFDDSSLSGEGIQFRAFLPFKNSGLLYSSGGSVKVTENYRGYRYEATASVVSLGLGGRISATENSDFFAVAGPSFSFINYGDGSSDTTGYFLALGFRTLIAERLDLTIAGEYSDFDGIDDTSFGVEARYWLGERFAVSFSVSPDSDVNTLGIGFSFAL